MDFVEVEHPELGRTTVPASAVQHLNPDWTVVSDMPGSYDPAEHNYDEVLAHLEQADDAEAARIVAAERAGKARVSILRVAETRALPEDPTTEPAPSVAAPSTETPEV